MGQGQTVVRGMHWSGSGQAVVRQWSGSDQTVARVMHWSDSGQAVVRGRIMLA
jgi:hypothetical protein